MVGSLILGEDANIEDASGKTTIIQSNDVDKIGEFVKDHPEYNDVIDIDSNLDKIAQTGEELTAIMEENAAKGVDDSTAAMNAIYEMLKNGTVGKDDIVVANIDVSFLTQGNYGDMLTRIAQANAQGTTIVVNLNFSEDAKQNDIILNQWANNTKIAGAQYLIWNLGNYDKTVQVNAQFAGIIAGAKFYFGQSMFLCKILYRNFFL